MSGPLVSVVIPFRGRRRWLEEAVASVVAQTLSDWECVLADDGSAEPLEWLGQVVAAEQRLRLLRLPHRGPAAARNAGLAAARGEFVLFLDSDDLLAPDALERLAAVGADAAFASWADFDDAAGPAGANPSPAPPFPDDPLASFLAIQPVVSAVLVRRAHAGRFPEEKWVNEAADFLFDAAARADTLAVVPGVVTLIRQHADPIRISNRFDHFDPLERGRMHADRKAVLRRLGRLNATRARILDGLIVGCAYALHRRRRGSQAASVLGGVDRGALRRRALARPASLEGFAGLLGPRTGVAAFYQLNRLLGRA